MQIIIKDIKLKCMKPLDMVKSLKGKGVKPAAGTKSTTKVAVIIGTSGKKKKIY